VRQGNAKTDSVTETDREVHEVPEINEAKEEREKWNKNIRYSELPLRWIFITFV
jgi:hypothetical protein